MATAHVVAGDFDQVAENVRQGLHFVAQDPAVRVMDPVGCTAYLRRAVQDVPHLAVLALTRPDGIRAAGAASLQAVADVLKAKGHHHGPRRSVETYADALDRGAVGMTEARDRVEQTSDTIGPPTWAHLDKLRTGKWGEYFAKMAFVRAGLDVYSPEVDDRSIDAIIRIPGVATAAPRYLEVQIKTTRATKAGYIFMLKRLFPIREANFLVVVRLAEGSEAELYLIPSIAWREPVPPFSSPDYEGKKSEPEHGLSVSPAGFERLRPYLFQNVLPGLLSGAWPA